MSDNFIVDGQLWTEHDWHVWVDGWTAGRAEGIARGRALADEEAVAAGREAAYIVSQMAEIPPRDREADSARRARIDARFERRNEGGAA